MNEGGLSKVGALVEPVVSRYGSTVVGRNASHANEQ